MKYKLCLLCLLLFICDCYSPAHGGISELLPIDETVELHLNGRSRNIENIIDSYKIKADKGDIDSQVTLGKIYYYGFFNVPVDYPKAIEWFSKAAALGDATAQYYLGYMHYDGRGTSRNYGEALKWLCLSSNNENPYALYYLGLMYYNGKYVKKDLDRSLEYFERSAKKGVVDAYYPTCDLYLNEKVKNKNYFNALYWAKKGSSYHKVECMSLAGFMYIKGLGCKKNLIIAYDYFNMAALHGDPPSQAIIGYLNFTGDVYPKDYVKAYAYCMIAASKYSGVVPYIQRTPNDIVIELSFLITKEQKNKAYELIRLIDNTIRKNRQFIK